MLRQLSLLLALPLALLTAAPAATAQSVPSGYTVRGTVVNAITGQPVARALVSMNQDMAMLTDSNGQFAIEGIASGTWSVSVSKPGFRGHGGFMTRRIVQLPAHPERPLEVQVGPDTPPLTVRLTPLATIVGRVTLSTADPADNIRLQILARGTENGHPHWNFAGQARTRSDGSFRIANLEPGSYMIATMASLDRPGQALNGSGTIWGYPALYYPGVTDPTAAGVLTLGAGQQAEADITVVRQQFFSVAALVHSSSDTPANFEILDGGGRRSGIPVNFDRREDIVRAAVPNGTWIMEAHAYGRNQEWGSTSFQVNGAPMMLAINLQTVPHIPMVVRREFQTLPDGSQFVTPGAGMNLTLVPASETDLHGAQSIEMIAVDGSNNNEWQLNINEPGRYWIQAQAFPPAYVSSITSGGTDLGSTPLVILPGSTPPAIEVTLRNDGGTITGQVNGVAAPGSAASSGQRPQLWIYAIPLFSTAASLPEASLQSNNQFTISNLAPGSYRVVACDAPQEIDFHSPEGLAAWAGKGQTVTVDPGGTANVDLDILHMNAGETP